MDNQNKNLAALEAILFAHGEPITKNKISSLLGVKVGEVSELIKALEELLEKEERGLCLIISEDKIQMVTKPAFGNMLESFIKEELNENLTPAALETLSLVAYFEPISRVKIDYLRGVNSSFILRNLMIRGLVERSADSRFANTFLYSTTFDFKKHLGINKKENLPDFQKFQELLKKFEESDFAAEKETVIPTSENIASIAENQNEG
ncbi:SMC-Scp complex subunit ScpB [Patescibacteria group bacterium]|nr:SMC-Scp complex subunit ScpB [Patescibacteria group bacterium]MCL5733536.1 SMC-Scp complex subunit ScpB [Patescibacteria group bacterium]